MALTRYTIVLASDIGSEPNDLDSGSLFSRINKVRSNHALAAQQAGNAEAYHNLATPYNTSQVQNSQSLNPDFISVLKSMFTDLKDKSPYISTDYGTAINVPSRGSYVSFEDIDKCTTALTNLESVVATNNAYYASGFNAGNYGFNGGFNSGNYGFNSGNYGFNSSFNSGNYGFNSSFNGAHDNSHNGSNFCGAFNPSESGWCRSQGFR